MTNTTNYIATDPLVTIYTDGACRGNPGPGGWGAVLSNGTQTAEICGGEAGTTSNRMELMAAIKALQWLQRARKVRLHTDSVYLAKGAKSWLHDWKNNGWRTSARKPVKNDDLWRELDGLLAVHTVEWVWVKAHVGIPGNERADALANRGIDELPLANPFQ